MIVFSLRYKDRLFYQLIASGQKITFGSGQKDTVRVLDMAEGQITISAAGEQVSADAPGFHQNPVPIGTPVRLGAAGTSLYISRATSTAAQRVKIPYDGIVRVGRSESNDVVIGLPFVSGKHFLLRITNGNVRVEDQGSTNGLYLNGQRITAAVLRFGDVLNILTVRIKLSTGCLEFENVGTALKARSVSSSAPSYSRTPDQQKYLRYRRSPRIREQMPHQCIALDNPPRKGQEYEPRGGGIMSAVSGAAMIGANIAMSAASPQLVVARSIYLVPQSMNFIYNLFNGRKLERERQSKLEEYIRQREDLYKKYIADQQAKITSVADQQRKIVTQENPEPLRCLQLAQGLDRTLWERSPRDQDFLDVRLGMGYENLCVDIKSRAELQGFRMEDDELEELCAIIAEENRIVDNVPARLPLRRCNSIGIIGGRSDAVHLVRNMIVSLTTQHSPQDVRIVGIFDDAERMAWMSMRWLPHIWDDNKQFRFLAFDPERAHSICELLTDTLQKRPAESGGYDKDKQAPTPHYVLVLGSRALVEREALMQLLDRNDPSLGVTALYLYNGLYDLPYDCQMIVDLNTRQNGGIPCCYDKSGYNKKFTFALDHFVSSSQFSEFARRLAAVELEDYKADNTLPGTITFLQGFGAKNVGQLGVLSRWRNRQNFDSLAAPIGVLANGKPFCLDIHASESAHGPHGLIAGTTGSGKSELLQTWILSMALNYHPHDISFVLIDYKGGGMANLVEPLPHVIGKITNIGGNIYRSLAALKNELNRRQLVLQEHGVNSIGKYQQLYRSGQADQPMPHLIIVSDEFAELFKEERAFMDELSSIARLGRSLGIHLVLATQKPAGVISDQIDTNTRFRICLKVNDVRDSKDVLKRPDAAMLTQPGRAYIRVGENELFQLFQSYWSGAAYTADQPLPEYPNQVRVVDVNGRRLQTVSEKKRRDENATDELTAIVRYIADAAKSAGIQRLPSPWLPELPRWLPLRSLNIPRFFNGMDWNTEWNGLQIPIGMFDMPARQMQGIQNLSFVTGSHLGIYGAAGTGKTNLLKTILLSLGLCHSPGDVNIHAIDSGRSMDVFARMPHTACVALSSDTDRIRKLTQSISQELEARKTKLQKHDVSSFKAYRETVGQDMPAIVIAVDNLSAAIEACAERDGNFLESFLLRLVSEGHTNGVYVAYTAYGTSGYKQDIFNKTSTRIALEQTDRTNYINLVTKPAEGTQLPEAPGQALLKANPPIYFQAAVYTDCENEYEGVNDLRSLFAQMCQAWTGGQVQQIKSTPDCVTVESLKPYYRARAKLPLGLDRDTGEPVFMDLREAYAMTVCETEGGAVDMLKNIAALLGTKPDNRLYIFDGGRRELDELASHSACYTVYTCASAVDAAVDALADIYEKRDDSRRMLGSNFHVEDLPQICILINDVCGLAREVSDQNRDAMYDLCRLAKDMGFLVIASGKASDLIGYKSVEPLTGAVLGTRKGLSVSGSPGAHRYFETDLSPEEKFAEPDPRYALVYDGGRVTHILRMQEGGQS